MTRPRIYGEDTPFGAWLRDRRDLDSVEFGLSALDHDFTLHRFRTNVDGLGPRAVQLLFDVEVKTRGGMPSAGHRQTLFFRHQLLNQRRWLLCNLDGDRKRVWHFGCFVLSMLDDRPPDDDQYVTWVSFTPTGGLHARTIVVADLVRILRCDVRPDTLEPLTLRRHHKVSRLVELVTTPLGFAVERYVTRRS